MVVEPLSPDPKGSQFVPMPRIVLLVEDSPVFEFQLREVLNIAVPGAIVHAFSHGMSAIRAVKSGELMPDLALIDLDLPDISGLEVIKSIYGVSHSIPSVVVSILDDQFKLLEAIRNGAKGYLLKGESPSALAKAIRDVLCGNYPISPAMARSLFQIAGAPLHESKTGTITLSDRETETIKWIAQGLSYMETANKMGVALSTIQHHVKNIYRKLDVNSQVQAVDKARRVGIIDP